MLHGHGQYYSAVVVAINRVSFAASFTLCVANRLLLARLSFLACFTAGVVALSFAACFTSFAPPI